MNQYDMRCPVCGKMNHQLLLEETDGWMECEYCGETTQQLRRMWKIQKSCALVNEFEHVAIPAV